MRKRRPTSHEAESLADDWQPDYTITVADMEWYIEATRQDREINDLLDKLADPGTLQAAINALADMTAHNEPQALLARLVKPGIVEGIKEAMIERRNPKKVPTITTKPHRKKGRK